MTRRIADETLLIPIAGRLADMQRIFALNPAGEYIWDLLDGNSTPDDILKGILSTFEVEKEQATADIREFIDELFKRDLIEQVH